jgi:hypothetical protein
MAWNDFNNKRILGTVPVADDGSAYFAVPADTYVYFQLLDEQGMMVQSMRSGTIVRPGERSGCVGCHDSRRGTVPGCEFRAALSRPPDYLQPWYGDPRTFSYTAEVQPVLDRRCVRCHDYNQPAGEKLNLSGDLLMAFNVSYAELRRKNYVRVVGAGPYKVQTPKSWGSHASRLVQVLQDGHGDKDIDREVQLTAEEFDRIVTWIDINAPYYAEYASAYRAHRYGRSPLSRADVVRLNELTGLNLNDQKSIMQVNLSRPELSPCLSALSGPQSAAYQEALAIIRAGREQLARVPRADMPNFQLVAPVEIEQQVRYQQRLAEENAMRQAIAAGRKRYGEGETDGGQ